MAICLCLAALLTGCAGEELSNVTLIQTLGVDGASPAELTAVGDGEEPTLYRVQGPDVAQAQENLKGLGETRLEVTHVAQLVLGPQADVAQTLWQAAIHRESGYGATVWLCADCPAGELLARAPNPSQRLKSLEENGGAEAPTILEALSALTREGRTELPVLALGENGLQVVGKRVIEEG